MKRILLLSSLLIFLLSGKIAAQDEAIFMHYHLNPVLVNPGATGFDGTYNLLLNVRTQWVGFADAPKTYGATYHGPLGKSFGIGLNLLSEQAAQINRLKLKLNYSFRFDAGEDLKIAAGFFTEFQQMSIDNEIMNSSFFQAGDRLLEEILNGSSEFDASVGVFGSYRGDTYAGITFNNLVKGRLDEISGTSNANIFSYYTFLLGHKFSVPDLKINIEPSLIVRQIKDVPFQVDLNLKASFLDDQLIAGLSYRTLGSVGILLGTKLSAFKMYYSYDLAFVNFQQYNTGSHEVTVAFTFKKKEKEIKKY